MRASGLSDTLVAAALAAVLGVGGGAITAYAATGSRLSALEAQNALIIQRLAALDVKVDNIRK